MGIKIKRSTLYSLLLVAALSACQASTPGPEATAKSFFEAVSSGNPQAVKMFIAESSPGLAMLGSQAYIGPAKGGKALVDKHGPLISVVPKLQSEHADNAIVEVTVTYKDGFSDKAPFPFQRVNGQWYYAPPQNNMGL